MSEIVDALASVHRADARRALVHVPATAGVVHADELWLAYRHYVEQLRAAALTPQSLLIAAVGNRAAFLPLTVACCGLGVAVMPVDAGTTLAEIVELAQRFGAAAVAVNPSAAAELGRPRSLLDGDVALVTCDPAASHNIPAGVAVMKLTSGSTGAPRATLTTEAQLVADATHIVQGMGIGPDHTQLAVIPLSHSYGLSVLALPLLLQGTPIVLRESFVPDQIVADARAYGARVFPGVPFMFDHFLGQPPAGGWPVTLRHLISAGARLPAETVQAFAAAFGVKIHSFYGTSETGGIAYDASEDPDIGSTVGGPLPGVSIEFVTHPDMSLPDGRVFVRSAAVACGYAGDGDDAFVDGGFLTSDCGAFDARGRLALTGRISTFVNVAGRKVDPSEVERVLRSLAGVCDVHVTSAPDARRGEHVVACVVSSTPLTSFAVRRFCSRRLAPHKIPRTILFLERIPRTARGKVDRRAIAHLVATRGD